MLESAAPMHGALLYLDGVTVSFDGFRALDGLSLVVDPGELRTIIGPNGAGKTTMMDVVTGRTRPDAGQVLFDCGIDLTRLDEASIANLGIGRKFQKPTVFDNLSVLDNLEIALESDRHVWPTLLARLSAAQRRRIDEVLATIGLGAHERALAGTLSHGQKQWLEIGMLLVQGAQLLLLDEPVAGMSDHETEKTAALIRAIVGERTVIVVEHDMAFVRELGARTTVLHEGKVPAEGSVEAVQTNPRVI
jgi:urea transport system ATP-binding protein